MPHTGPLFVSQTLKYTTTTTQLLTDMGVNLPKWLTAAKDTGEGPQLPVIVCMEAAAAPSVGEPQSQPRVVYGTTCGKFSTPATLEEQKLANKCKDDSNCKQCGGNSSYALDL